MSAKQGLTVFDCLTERSDLRQVTIDDKMIETLSSNWVTSECKTIHIPPPSPPFKVRVFVVFYRRQTAAEYGMEGVEEIKHHFLLYSKTSKNGEFNQ